MLEYIEALREEFGGALAKDDGWNKPTMAQHSKLDSSLKES